MRIKTKKINTSREKKVVVSENKDTVEKEERDNINKSQLNLNEFVGWFIALMFPFAAYGLMEITRIPILSALIYYGVCGIYIRMKLDGKLPYFRPQMHKVKIEIGLFAMGGILCGALYLSGSYDMLPLSWELILNLFAFALLNGSFEHLVWVNIYDLAGVRKKYLGVIASTIYVGLIHVFYWTKFLPTEGIKYLVLFVVAQMLIFYIPLRIYEKTKDLTIWSIQHILYNCLSVLFGGFSIIMYLTY